MVRRGVMQRRAASHQGPCLRIGAGVTSGASECAMVERQVRCDTAEKVEQEPRMFSLLHCYTATRLHGYTAHSGAQGFISISREARYRGGGAPIGNHSLWDTTWELCSGGGGCQLISSSVNSPESHPRKITPTSVTTQMWATPCLLTCLPHNTQVFLQCGLLTD